MTIKISEELKSVSIDELLGFYSPMPENHDIRYARTEKDIQDKIDALVFPEDLLVRVEQPFLVYQLEEQQGTDKYTVLNGVTRMLALEAIKNDEKYSSYTIQSVPVLYLEDGWTEDEIKSLQHSANNFTNKTEEILLAIEAVSMWERYEELAKETNKDKIKGVRKLNEYAINYANETIFKSPIMRGKNKADFDRYKKVINNGVEMLIDLCKEKILTVRVASDFLTLYNNYLKSLKNTNVEHKTQTYILDLKLAEATKDAELLSEKNGEKINPRITLPDFKSWFEANTPGKNVDSVVDNESEDNETDTPESNEDRVINIDELTKNLKECIIFSETYQPVDKTRLLTTKERVNLVKSKFNLIATAIDTIDDSLEINKHLDSMLDSLGQFLSDIPQPTASTNKLDKFDSAVRKHKDAIEKIYLAEEKIKRNEQENKQEEINADDTIQDDEELTADIGEFTVTSK